MKNLIRALLAAFRKRKPRIYIDASAFDPDESFQDGRAVLIVACNESATITGRVRKELEHASGVVVLDQGSRDATAQLAAEAGAIVVLQEPGMSRDEAMQKAVQVAYRFSDRVQIARD